jgi:hypothetical protein
MKQLTQPEKKQSSNNNANVGTKKTVKERLTRAEVSRTTMNKASHKFDDLDKKVQTFLEDKTHSKYLRALEEEIISACGNNLSVP